MFFLDIKNITMASYSFSQPSKATFSRVHHLSSEGVNYVIGTLGDGKYCFCIFNTTPDVPRAADSTIMIADQQLQAAGPQAMEEIPVPTPVNGVSSANGYIFSKSNPNGISVYRELANFLSIPVADKEGRPVNLEEKLLRSQPAAPAPASGPSLFTVPNSGTSRTTPLTVASSSAERVTRVSAPPSTGSANRFQPATSTSASRFAPATQPSFSQPAAAAAQPSFSQPSFSQPSGPRFAPAAAAAAQPSFSQSAVGPRFSQPSAAAAAPSFSQPAAQPSFSQPTAAPKFAPVAAAAAAPTFTAPPKFTNPSLSAAPAPPVSHPTTYGPGAKVHETLAAQTKQAVSSPQELVDSALSLMKKYKSALTKEEALEMIKAAEMAAITEMLKQAIMRGANIESVHEFTQTLPQRELQPKVHRSSFSAPVPSPAKPFSPLTTFQPFVPSSAPVSEPEPIVEEKETPEDHTVRRQSFTPAPAVPEFQPDEVPQSYEEQPFEEQPEEQI